MLEPYESNEQDEIIGDAMAVGGPAFVEELHYSAMEAAESVVPWDGDGEEPAAYRAIWVAFARKMVIERRLQLRARPPSGQPHSGHGNDDPGRSSSASGRSPVISRCPGDTPSST